MTRGPHEHVDQADLFCFFGPSNFKLRLWDNRETSPSHGRCMTIFVGADNPASVLVPKGVVHAYKNVGDKDGWVFNAANRLYAGWLKQEPVDEIRHEDAPGSPYRLDD